MYLDGGVIMPHISHRYLFWRGSIFVFRLQVQVASGHLVQQAAKLKIGELRYHQRSLTVFWSFMKIK